VSTLQDQPRPADAADDAPEAPAGARGSVTAAIWFRVLLAALLLLPWVVGLGIQQVNENRRETEFPSLEGDGLLETATFRQTDQALKDRLSLKVAVIRAMGETSVSAGQSLTDRVVTGSDGTPFSSEEFVKPCRQPIDWTLAEARLGRWQAAARERGGDVFLAVAPDKSSIERAKLGAAASDLLACADPVRVEAERRWADDPNAPVLTLWEQAEANAARYPDQAYQRGDTHWTARGAAVFAEEVVDRLSAPGSPAAQADPSVTGIDYAADLREYGTRERFGDLYRLMGSNRLDVVPVLGTERPGVDARRSVVPGETFRGVRTYRANGGGTVPVIPGTTLIVHDSFYDAAEQQLSPYFRKAIVMHWADLSKAAADGTLPAVDRVVFQTSQRSFGERVMQALADPATQIALDRALGVTPTTLD
jgi:hypothetical protein